jgi:glycerol dehydrogenase-like iron-containing ADH family enzyme
MKIDSMHVVVIFCIISVRAISRDSACIGAAHEIIKILDEINYRFNIYMHGHHVSVVLFLRLHIVWDEINYR